MREDYRTFPMYFDAMLMTSWRVVMSTISSLVYKKDYSCCEKKMHEKVAHVRSSRLNGLSRNTHIGRR